MAAATRSSTGSPTEAATPAEPGVARQLLRSAPRRGGLQQPPPPAHQEHASQPARQPSAVPDRRELRGAAGRPRCSCSRTWPKPMVSPRADRPASRSTCFPRSPTHGLRARSAVSDYAVTSRSGFRWRPHRIDLELASGSGTASSSVRLRAGRVSIPVRDMDRDLRRRSVIVHVRPVGQPIQTDARWSEDLEEADRP